MAFVAFPPGYLVVDDHMDGAMSCVGWQVTQVEGLIHNALASKRCVPMQKDGHDLQICKRDCKSSPILTTLPTGPLQIKSQSASQKMFSEPWLVWLSGMCVRL